jgi:hypothetical protein
MGVEDPRPKYPEDTVAGGLQGEPRENPSSRSKSMSADRQPARSPPSSALSSQALERSTFNTLNHNKTRQKQLSNQTATQATDLESRKK